MADRYGSTLYPKEFVEKLPKPDADETRPLLMLLRGQHADSDAEIERIERWFQELDGAPERKATLAGNLRSLHPVNFWAALYELMTSRVFVERGWKPRYEVPIAGLTPDFAVPYDNNQYFVAEVVTAFQEGDYRRVEADLHYVANALAQVRHRTAVFIKEVELPAARPSLKPLLQLVSAWLDACRPDESAVLSLLPDEVGLSVTLSTVGTRPEAAPIVEGIVGPGGKISTHQTIRDAIRRKSSK